MSSPLNAWSRTRELIAATMIVVALVDLGLNVCKWWLLVAVILLWHILTISMLSLFKLMPKEMLKISKDILKTKFSNWETNWCLLCWCLRYPEGFTRHGFSKRVWAKSNKRGSWWSRCQTNFRGIISSSRSRYCEEPFEAADVETDDDRDDVEIGWKAQKPDVEAKFILIMSNVETDHEMPDVEVEFDRHS